MECNNCHSKWDTEKRYSASLVSCPFCGTSIAVDDGKPKVFDTSKEALIFIMSQYGSDVLLGKRLKFFFPDYAPQVNHNIKRLVFSVCDTGAAQILQSNLNAFQEDKEIAFKQAVAKLTEAYVVQNAAEGIILEFIEALGWEIRTTVHISQKVTQQHTKGFAGRKLEGQIKIEKPAVLMPKTGDVLFLGTYQQSKTGINGNEKIAWRILAIDNDKAFLLADKILDVQPYNVHQIQVTWEACTLREWLNEDFYNAAFTSAEKEKILTTDVMNEDNNEYGTPGGNNTKDKIFLLSLRDATNPAYGFKSNDSINDARQAQGTDYAIYTGRLFVRKFGFSDWWLRSPGTRPSRAGIVDYEGDVSCVYDDFIVGDTGTGVRPALWIHL